MQLSMPGTEVLFDGSLLLIVPPPVAPGASMELDLECVASFLVLCEEGHFGRAAAHLHLTSPALSKRIQRLEHQVGVTLIDRGPAGTTALTAAGWQFADQAAVVMENARMAREAARTAARTKIQAVIRIGVPGIASTDLMMRPLVGPLQALRHRIPGLIIDCVGVPYGMAIDGLLAGMVDILWSPSAVLHPSLESRPIGTAPRVGIVPAHHPMAELPDIAVEDFADLPFLYNPAVPPELMSPGCLGDVRPISDAHLISTTIQGLSALRNEIMRGRGVAVLPLLLGMDIGPGLHSLHLLGLAPTSVHAVYRHPTTGTRVQEVIQLMLNISGRNGWL